MQVGRNCKHLSQGVGWQRSHPIASMLQLDVSIALAGASRGLIMRVDWDTLADAGAGHGWSRRMIQEVCR